MEFEGLPLNQTQQIIGALVLKHCQGETTITIEELTDVKGIIMYFENGKFKIRSFKNEKE